MNSWLARLVAVVALIAMHPVPTAVAQENASPTAMAELMVLSGLDIALIQFGPNITAVARTSELAGDRRLVESWEQTADAAFDADDMAADLRTLVLASPVSVTDHRLLMEFYTSDLGREIVRFESEVVSLPLEASLAAILNGSELMAVLSPRRAGQYERLWDIVGEASQATATEMMRHVYRGIAILAGADRATANLDTALELMLPQIVKMMVAQEQARYAFMYQQLTDDELELYLDFLATPAARNYSRIAVTAIGTVVRTELQSFVEALKRVRPGSGA